MGDITENFSRWEFACPCCGKDDVSVNLVNLLQELRDALGHAVSISSGVRCPAHNSAVGGTDTSDHLTGEGVDIRCANSHLRFRIIQLAIVLGLRRIGVSGNFIHLGVAPHNPQDVCWTY